MDSRNTLLEKLEHEIAWQWKWEKLHRYYFLGALWTTWISNFLVLVLAAYQIYLRDHPQYWVTVAIVLLATLTISLPMLSWKLKWEERQYFYDKLARKYEVIKMKLETDQIDVTDAVKQFEKLHTKTSEIVVSKTI